MCSAISHVPEDTHLPAKTEVLPNNEVAVEEATGVTTSPIPLEEYFVGPPERKTLLSNGHGVKNPRISKLQEAQIGVEQVRLLEVIRFDAPNVVRLGAVEGVHEQIQLQGPATQGNDSRLWRITSIRRLSHGETGSKQHDNECVSTPPATPRDHPDCT